MSLPMLAALILALLLGAGAAAAVLHRVRRRAPTANLESDSSDRLARLLVDEFEAHSNGWFWRTDAEGCLS